MAVQKIPTLINHQYFAQYSILPRNYDLTEVENFIHPTEKIWIEPILGTPLYEELLDQVCDNQVTELNSTLLLNIYPLLCTATVITAMPFIAYRASEVGLVAGKSENAEPAGIKAVNYLTERLTAQANTMKRLLKKFLDDNADKYPLYPSRGHCDCECSEGDRWMWDYYFGGPEDRYDVQRWLNHCRIKSDEPRPKAVIWGIPRESVSMR